MLSRQDQELLTRVGPGTPCGALLRRYWMPICPAAELSARTPKKRVRILGEDLLAFRDGKGRYGLVEAQCRHRKMELYFGFVEDEGIRCAYHGWKYDVSGKCIEQPFEPADSPLKAEACLRSYPVQQLAGILFGYLGPLPAPLLPRWEPLVRTDGTREISVLPLHKCNWLQAQENSVDTVHTYYLHGHMMKQLGVLDDEVGRYYYRPVEKYDFELVEEPAWAGIRKVRHWGGDRPEKEVGHPAIFPNILLAPQGAKLVMHFRVPVDDEHTYIIWSEFSPTEDGATVQQDDADIPVSYFTSYVQPDGSHDLSTFMRQDQAAWETQGSIYDRTTELLGVSDRGVVMLRNQLKQQILAVQAGKEPVGVIRDPTLNETIRFVLSQGQARMAREAMKAAAAAAE